MRILTRTKFNLISLAVLFPLVFLFPPDSRAEDFVDPAFKNLWDQTDRAVAAHQSNRPWLWGEAPLASKQEFYDDAFGGSRLVQYFDKGRMELNNPFGQKSNPYYVTNGLLTKELASGMEQVGDNRFLSGVPAEIPVAGDGENNPLCPTYATFGKAGLASLAGSSSRSPDQTGQPVTSSLNREGQTGTLSSVPLQISFAFYSPELGHNIPTIFWSWLNTLEPNWVQVMGLPISEAYWSPVRVGGESRTVLIQLYERRVLTFTFDNPPAFQVEMGNIGRHYYQWRYESGGLRVLSYRTYRSEVSRVLYLVGVIFNDGNIETRYSLSATLLDQAGIAVKDSDSVVDALSIIPARSKSPFRLLVPLPPPNFGKIDFDFQILPFFKTIKAKFNYSLQPKNLTFGESLFGLQTINGQLENRGQVTSFSSQVIAVGYDANGEVLDVESTYTDPSQIEPGESAPFTLPFLRVKEVATYEIFTEGRT